MALQEILSLRRSAISILWCLFALRLQNKGVKYGIQKDRRIGRRIGGLEAIVGLHHRPKKSLKELYDKKLIINLNESGGLGHIVLSSRGLQFMKELCHES